MNDLPLDLAKTFGKITRKSVNYGEITDFTWDKTRDWHIGFYRHTTCFLQTDLHTPCLYIYMWYSVYIYNIPYFDVLLRQERWWHISNDTNWWWENRLLKSSCRAFYQKLGYILAYPAYTWFFLAVAKISMFLGREYPSLAPQTKVV